MSYYAFVEATSLKTDVSPENLAASINFSRPSRRCVLRCSQDLIQLKDWLCEARPRRLIKPELQAIYSVISFNQLRNLATSFSTVLFPSTVYRVGLPLSL